jgi:PKHD-type hydroxylase
MYHIPPSQDPQRDNTSYAFLDNVLTEEECKTADLIGGRLRLSDAAVNTTFSEKDVINSTLRKNKLGWMQISKETEFIYSKISQVVAVLNSKYFGLNISGIYEPLQYTLYNESGDHYGWHVDLHPQTFVPRKLSVVAMLSDSKEFRGGDLQLMTEQEPTTLENKKGRIYVFPSYVLHRVTPVTHGVRRTIVAWVGGEKFK